MADKTLADRPRYNTLPVPYVTRWEFEPANVPYGVRPGPDGPCIAYAEETRIDRDHKGVLWLREFPSKNGKGKPEFSQVSSYRQRNCMQKKMCQMCGTRLEAPYNFLMAPGHMEEYNSSKGCTVNAPVCAGCLLQAPIYCPHLRNYTPTRIIAEDFERVGVMGEVLLPTKEDSFTRTMLPVLDTAPVIQLTLARQVIVQLKRASILG